MVAKLRNDPLWPCKAQKIQRFFNFRRVDLSLLTFQHGSFEDGERFEGGHSTREISYQLASLNPVLLRCQSNVMECQDKHRLEDYLSESYHIGVICHDSRRDRKTNG